jgi:hypothetical protein
VTTHAEIAVFRAEYQNCAIDCCDQSIREIQEMKKRVLESLSNGKY